MKQYLFALTLAFNLLKDFNRSLKIEISEKDNHK